MSVDTADIIGTTGANFTFTISSGSIVQALLEVPGKPKQKLTVSGDGSGATVPSLAPGDSGVRLDLVWGPEDPDAVIDVGTVTSGTVTPAPAKGILTAGETPGLVRLFGTGAKS